MGDVEEGVGATSPAGFRGRTTWVSGPQDGHINSSSRLGNNLANVLVAITGGEHAPRCRSELACASGPWELKTRLLRISCRDFWKLLLTSSLHKQPKFWRFVHGSLSPCSNLLVSQLMRLRLRACAQVGVDHLLLRPALSARA
eukprot:9475457-Pyramimonas_sp.AAC.1